MPNEVLKFLNPYYEKWVRGRPSKQKLLQRKKAIEYQNSLSNKTLNYVNCLITNKPLDKNISISHLKYFKRNETK